MDIQDILARHDQQQRIDITDNGLRREATLEVVRHVGLEDKCGLHFLAIAASPTGRAIVEKHGFQFLEYTQPHKYHTK